MTEQHDLKKINDQASNLTNTIKTWGTLFGFIAGILAGVFGAGQLYQSARTLVVDYVGKVDKAGMDITSLAGQLDTLASELKGLRDGLVSASPADAKSEPKTEISGNSTLYKSECRPGHYAVAVEVEGFPRGPAEFVRYARVICAPLNVGSGK